MTSLDKFLVHSEVLKRPQSDTACLHDLNATHSKAPFSRLSVDFLRTEEKSRRRGKLDELLESAFFIHIVHDVMA